MAKNMYSDVAAVLKAAGSTFLRQGKGSHEIWKSAEGQHFTVPSTLKSNGTRDSIIKQAGIAQNWDQAWKLHGEKKKDKAPAGDGMDWDELNRKAEAHRLKYFKP